MSLGGDIKRLTFFPTPLHTQQVGDVKEPTFHSERVGELCPMLWFTSHISFSGGEVGSEMD